MQTIRVFGKANPAATGNSIDDYVLKGRGFKPRRRCTKSTAASAAEVISLHSLHAPELLQRRNDLS